MHTYSAYVISAPLCMYRSLEAPSKTSDTIFDLGSCDALVCCFSLQRTKEGRLLLNEVVGGMVMWFRTLAESVVGIKIDHGVTLEGPVLRASQLQAVFRGVSLFRFFFLL